MNLKEIEKEIIDRTITKITSLATKIRGSCFAYCISLTDVSLPNVTEIGMEAFCNCSALTDVSLPNVTRIENSAFLYCDALTDVSLPKVTYISSSAFTGCSALTDVSLPKATIIDDFAFAQCINLNLHLYTGLTSIKNLGGILLSNINTPPKSVYFHYTDSDEVLFSPTDAIGVGTTKGTLTYNIYTDNTIIKNGVLSKANQYTIVNVKHLDGSDWQ